MWRRATGQPRTGRPPPPRAQLGHTNTEGPPGPLTASYQEAYGGAAFSAGSPNSLPAPESDPFITVCALTFCSCQNSDKTLGDRKKEEI